MDYDPGRTDLGGRAEAGSQKGCMASGRREWSCPICCDLLRDIAHALPCCHEFCLGCILRWLRGTRTCPLCRRLISTVSFSEQEEDCPQCIMRHPREAGNAGGSAPQDPLSPAEQAAAGPGAVGGILPELWAELFRRRWHLLNPVRSWLQQWLQKMYGERWWQVKIAESSILLALCMFGPERAVLQQRLQPRLRRHTALLVQGVLSIIETQCSQEVRRLRGCHHAQEQAQSPAASSGSPASPEGAPASGGPPGSEVGRAEGAAQGGPGRCGAVPEEPEQP
ncbi:hypothetical protein Nmel_007797 [Mimus melanotis]